MPSLHDSRQARDDEAEVGERSGTSPPETTFLINQKSWNILRSVDGAGTMRDQNPTWFYSGVRPRSRSLKLVQEWLEGKEGPELQNDANFKGPRSHEKE